MIHLFHLLVSVSTIIALFAWILIPIIMRGHLRSHAVAGDLQQLKSALRLRAILNLSCLTVILFAYFISFTRHWFAALCFVNWLFNLANTISPGWPLPIWARARSLRKEKWTTEELKLYKHSLPPGEFIKPESHGFTLHPSLPPLATQPVPPDRDLTI